MIYLRPDGAPAFYYDEVPVVSADAITLLSGVNFGSVRKVLAALHLLREFSGTSCDQLARVEDLPTHRCDPMSSDPGDLRRTRSARRVCDAVADTTGLSGYDTVDGIVHFRDRLARLPRPGIL